MASRAILYLKITEHTVLGLSFKELKTVCKNIFSARSSVVPNSGQIDYRKNEQNQEFVYLYTSSLGCQTRKYWYLEAQMELGGKLVIFYYETRAATRLQPVLEPQKVSRYSNSRPLLDFRLELCSVQLNHPSQPTVWKLIQTIKSIYLEPQTELSGKLLIFCHETHAATRLQTVLES